MSGEAVSKLKGLQLFPPPPKGFDALGASPKELAQHGLPQRPDPRTQPSLAALWEKAACRYQSYEHLEPKLIPVDKPKQPAAGLGLEPQESCGFELFDASSPITQFSGMWTIPDLNNTPNQSLPNSFRTFFGLGFLDVHVEMTVDVNESVTAVLLIEPATQVGLPVRPGDAIRCTLCLQTDSAATAFFGFVNETTAQTMRLQFQNRVPARCGHQRRGQSRQFNQQRPARSAGPVRRGVLRRSRRLLSGRIENSHQRHTDHDGRLQRKNAGDPAEDQRFGIQGDLQRKLILAPSRESGFREGEAPAKQGLVRRRHRIQARQEPRPLKIEIW